MILTSCGIWFTECRDRPRAIDRHIDFFGESRVPTSPRLIASVPARTEGETRTRVRASAEEHPGALRQEVTTRAYPLRSDGVSAPARDTSEMKRRQSAKPPC